MVNNSLTTTISTTSTASNLVFIDTAVDNFSGLLAGLKANTEAVILDPNQDGISQITKFLAQRSTPVESIQILSHGSAGNVQLGSTSLSLDNLEQYKTSLQTWFSPLLGKTPDLLIYGCDVAAGTVGDAFISKLSQITGADVAASVDLTGNVAKGGNWLLEKATGAIEAGQAFTKKVRDAYQDVLGTFTVTNNNDSGAGSLRQAIIDANNIAGADDIVFNIGAGGVQTIALQSPLPEITTQINLDGTTQPGSGGKPAIELRGDQIPAFTTADSWKSDFTNGLTFFGTPGTGSSNSVAKGFIINRFQSNGIKVGRGNNYSRTVQGPSGVLLENNYIGTDSSGTVGLGNGWWGDPNVSNGIYIHRSPNTIVRNNLISGNTTTALIVREGSTGVLIEENKIGTDVTGTLPLGNQRWSTYINQGSDNVIYRKNLVAAGGYDHETHGMELFLSWGVRNLRVENNTFGMDITRTKSFRNRGEYQRINTTTPLSLRSFSMGNATVGTGNFINRGWTSQPAGNTTVNLPNPPRPILTPIIPKLQTIPNDITTAANQGQLISSLIGSSISNLDTNPDGSQDKGISITQVNNTNGTWQYSTDNGTNWSDLATAMISKYRPQNNPPNPFTPAFLLSADNKNRIRFVPNAGFSGTVTNGVVYNGWNQRTAGNGLIINIATSGRTNLAPLLNSLSVNADTLNIKVNKAPILDPILVSNLNSILENPVTNPGTLVSAIIAGAFSDEQAVLKGIAVTAVDNSNGIWQYALDGTTWQAFGSPSNTNARLLAADGTTKIRFVPNANYIGTPAISFRAWDQFADWGSTLVAGDTTNVSTNGVATAFSSEVAEAKIAVGTPPIPVVPGVPTPPISTISDNSAPIDPGIFPLLRNPDAPATPAPVIVGEPPVDSPEPSTPISDNNPSTVIPNPSNTPPTEITPPQGTGTPNNTTKTYQGTNEDDFLVGTAEQESFYGKKGKDTLWGARGDDNLYGAQGDDFIRGGRGKDLFIGGHGNERMKGGRGNDNMTGGAG